MSSDLSAPTRIMFDRSVGRHHGEGLSASNCFGTRCGIRDVKIRGHRVSTDKAQIRHRDLQGRVPIKHPRRKGEVRIVVICPERVELSYRELNSTTIIACGYFPMLTNRTRLMSPAGYTVLECFNRHGCDSYVYLFTMRRPPSLSNSRRFACIIVRHRQTDQVIHGAISPK